MPRRFDFHKPFKHKEKRKRLTIMFVPDSSAKIKRISIPYWVFGLVIVPLLCLVAIIILYQYRIIDLGELADNYESRVRYSSRELNDAVRERNKLEDTLSNTEDLLEQSISDAAVLRSQLDDFEERLAQLLLKVDDIDELKQNILGTFQELQELDIPYTFNESVLTSSTDNPAGGMYTGDTQAILAELDIVLANEMHDLQVLEEYANTFLSFFRTRPSGLPVPGGQIISGYGYRRNPFTGIGREMHEGIDIPAKKGDGIYATADGVVTYSGWHKGGYGVLVVIGHNHGYSTYYAHNSRVVVKEGETVTRGQLIALAGSTGRSTGNHCHYEVRKNGVPQNPRLYIDN